MKGSVAFALVFALAFAFRLSFLLLLLFSSTTFGKSGVSIEAKSGCSSSESSISSMALSKVGTFLTSCHNFLASSFARLCR